MSDFAACTIVAHNYLPLARILAHSFLDHHPQTDFYIVLVDRPAEARVISEPGIRIVPITDIDFGTEGFGHMATFYDVTEFATAVKPFALKHLLKQHDCVLYLDPDIKVYGRLDELVRNTIEVGWSVTPHCLEPIPRTGAGPTEREIMGAGVFNLGYIGVTKRLEPLLDWWSERLRRDSIIDVENQLFTDQRWIDLAVGIFQPYIERSPSYNVAYWNLDQRDVKRVDGLWRVDGEPLKFFHFSGYDPTNPHWMSKYQPGIPRVLFSDRPELVPLFEEYGQELLAIQPEDGRIPTYGWAEPFPGFRLSRGLRRLFRREVLASDRGEGEMPPPAFAPRGLSKFVEWCKSPSPSSLSGLPRYAQGIFEERHDLQSNFHEVNGGQLNRFNDWVRKHGRSEHIEFELFSYSSGENGSKRENLSSFSMVRDLGRTKRGIDVVGYLKAELGVGEAARLAISALAANDIPVSTINCDLTLSRQSHPYPVDDVASHYAVLMAVNADQLGIVRHSLGPDFFKGRYVIGQWFWELSAPPKSYLQSFQLLHEVWAPTRFIQESLKSLSPPHVMIHHMPLPIVTPTIDLSLTKRSFGIPETYTFLFTFDFLSVLKRKNPIAVVSAFCRAFGENEGPVLVLKCINGHKRLNELERLKWAIRNRSDVILIDEYFDARTTASLTSVTDCYVSLHRSEGLGLTMAEAMALGKPVIATGYSGNTDFMDTSNSILVPYDLSEVGPDAEGYAADAIWAEPDIEQAASEMRNLYLNPEVGIELGRIAQADIARRFSAKETGRKMKSHLENVVWR